MSASPEAGQNASGKNPLVVRLAAGALLCLMGALMVSSAWNDTITMDEAPHIGAGYAYLRKSDFRLNPEHPPLMKDLGALPLLFLNLSVDWNHPSWTQDPYGQWDFGLLLLYRSGQDPDMVTRLTKAPMILFTLLLGWVLFRWTQKRFGGAAALLALGFFVFSPTFLAHGRLVATDVGAAAGFFVGVVAFLHFLQNPGPRNVLLAGLAMGFALLTKFSTVALLPLALLMAAFWATLHEATPADPFFRFRRRAGGCFVAVRPPAFRNAFLRLLPQTAGVFAIAFLLVYVVYAHHMLRYPLERQRQDTAFVLSSNDASPATRRAISWMVEQTPLRPWAGYLLGLVATLERSERGNNPFFWGRVRTSGSALYFPFVYLAKEPLAFHLLTLLAMGFALLRLRRPAAPAAAPRPSRRQWAQAHFTECSFLLVIAFYWALALRSNLNIGVRHLLPVFPFLYVLVAKEIAQIRLWRFKASGARGAVFLLLGGLLAWQAASVVRTHPSYLAYFNELVGGPDGGWRYVTDSNVDWGQDLKRLAAFVRERNLPEIQLHYFGSADPAYYLKEKYRGLSSCTETLHGWVAVSAMIYPGPPWKPECDYRQRLPLSKLVAKIGYSIFVFHLE
ncbi:MAG TPA: glycosyltransferase family 39 protein [Terriglobia bacterium]|nr:glycosyltransferase family 39 protein [Terriglobia bacterium]